MNDDELKKVRALAQRGLSDREILLAAELNKLTPEHHLAIEKGRAAGVALVNSKLFDQAMAGDVKAVAELNRKLLSTSNHESYADRQLRILRELNDNGST